MPDLAVNDLLLNAPPDGSALPHITPAMLVDEFADQGVILGGSGNQNRPIRWFLPLGPGEEHRLGSIPLSSARLLLVVKLEDVPQLMRDMPGAYLLTETHEDAEEIDDLKRYGERLIVLKSGLSEAALLLRLQNLFLRMLLWENDLERIVLKEGTLSDLLDASIPILKNFIFVSDNDFNIIAHTSKIEPPDALHASIIKNGCLTQRTIEEKRFRLPEKTFYTRAASELTPFDRISYPIHLQHTYFGSVSMSCNVRPDTEGLRDQFRIFLRYARRICERTWSQQAAAGAPSYFFSRLLRHEPVTTAYLEAQMEEHQLPPDGLFKVLIFDVDPSIEPEIAHAVEKAATALNGGRIKCFPYEHDVVAVCYSAGRDGELSHRKTILDVHRSIHDPFGIACGASSVFSDITNVDMAYRQAKIALGFRRSIERELHADESQAPAGVYLFEDALLYYLVDPSVKDERFMRFAFNATIVNILWEEDVRNRTNYLTILWFYLQSERNATATAQKLHLHRNTVLYHIEKIQQRFDFDMNEKSARDWLLVCFKSLFSAQSSESLFSILETDDPDQRTSERSDAPDDALR